MTTSRGRDIYLATEKDYDTSGYREKVCHQWLANQPADFHSPTALKTDKQGQKYKRQSQKFVDMNELANGSQRYESSRVRQNSNDDDFIDPFSDYENRLNKVQNDTLKQTKHNQQMPIGHRNEKVHEKLHRQTQAQVKPHRRGRDVYEEMEKDFDTNGHLKKVGHQWPVDQRRSADFYSPTALELDEQGQTYKRQSRKFVDINEPVKGGQHHESSRARRNNNDDDFLEQFFGYEHRSNKIKNDVTKPKHSQQMPKCQSDGNEHVKPHRQSLALVKPHQKYLEKLHQSRIDTRHPDKRSTKRKNDENLNFLADFGDDHGRGKKRKNDDDFVSPVEFGGGNHNNLIIKAANQGMRALKAMTSSTQPTIIQIFIKTD